MIAVAFRLIGWGGVLALFLLAFYEGVPYASRIPFVKEIPLVAGYRHTYAADQVKLATANMVSTFELETAKAQLETERRYREAAEQANSEAQKRADAASVLASQRQEALARALAATSGFQTPTKDELEWLKQR